jgi:hypothetical protein
MPKSDFNKKSDFYELLFSVSERKQGVLAPRTQGGAARWKRRTPGAGRQAGGAYG